MSTTPVTSSNPTSGSGSTSTSGLPSGQSLNNMFLQLLIAQLQNQDPTQPVDPSTFIGQLAQFSELSEVTSIYQLLTQVIPGSGTSTSETGTSSGDSAQPAAATPNAVPPVDGMLPSQPAPAAVLPASSLPTSSPAANPQNFFSPSVSALTNKLQGVF